MLMKLLVVRDESSKILGHRYLNSQISFYVGLLQLAICIWAMAQHVYSIVHYKKILYCDFVNGTEPVLLVGVDIIIFDIGLFHSLWGIDSCVAQHLDGGYGRCMWCICHIVAFIICLPFAFVSRPRPYFLWPLLIQQSAYGVGLLILSLAALPRVLPTFTGEQNSASVLSVSIYAAGASLNFFLLYIYWHWYWHVEAMWSSARKLRSDRVVPNASQRTRRAPFRHANITEEITPQQIQQRGLSQQAQRVTSRSSPAAPRQRKQELTGAETPENFHRMSNPDDIGNYKYHLVQPQKAARDGYRNEYLAGRGEEEKLLEAHGVGGSQDTENNNNELPLYAVYNNGYLPCEQQPQQLASSPARYRCRSPIHQVSYFSSRGSDSSDSSQMRKSRRSCRPSMQTTTFVRRFGGSQRRPLVRQPAKQYSINIPSPRHCVAAPSPSTVEEYAFCSPRRSLLQ